MQSPRSPYLRYGLALVFVGAALCLSVLFQGVISDGFLIFFLSAVMLTSWFGRTGPGIFSVFLSMAAAACYFIPSSRSFALDIKQLPYFLAFLLSALVTSWLGSARRAVEEKQKAHLDKLFEQTPEAIMLVDPQDRVLRVNRQFTHMFGYAIQEIGGRHSLDLIVPHHLKTEALKTRERLIEGQEVSLETIRQAKDGSHFDVSEVSFPVIADGRCIGYYAIFRDITASNRAIGDLHKTQAELARLSRITTMGELAASIAHEVNQPIGAIATNSNAARRWLEQDPPNLDGAMESLDSIVRDANRAAQVIGRIHSFLEKQSIPRLPVDLNEVIREVLLLTGHETTRRGATVLTELDSDIPPVTGDRVQLQQVMLNLIMNSLDAMSTITGRPRELIVRSSRGSNNVCLEVLDSGHGLGDQLPETIFDSFFTTKKDGMGMGLTISRSIVEAHGGRLWAERRTPHGAIFKFALPIATGVK